METYKDRKVVKAASRAQWRRWLQKNHESEKSIWLVIHHKGSDKKSVRYDEAVEEALCFGWIDSVVNKRDDESVYQLFSQRRPKSNWSKLNRARVEKLIEQKLMTPAGQKLIDIAKENGTWEALADVQASVVPDDLGKLLSKNKKALKIFSNFLHRLNGSSSSGS